MDPYLEAHWRDIHAGLIIYARDALQGALPRGLRARVEESVLLETPEGLGDHPLFRDVRVVEARATNLPVRTTSSIYAISAKSAPRTPIWSKSI
jgi:hypothetical protein